MKRSTQWVGVLALMAVGSIVAAWVVSLRSRPNVSSLLDLIPAGADVVAVVDMQALESNPVVKRLLADPPDLPAAGDYQQLLRESGFHYQDDLKQLAAAKLGENWVGAAIVNIDRARLVQYLESQGAIESRQGDNTVYSFGSVRPFRLAFLKDNWIGFAVGADPALLSGVLDRFSHGGGGSFMDASRMDASSKDASRGGGAESYPPGAGLWLIARMDRLLNASPQGVQVGSFQLGKEWLEGSKTLVGVVNSGPLSLDLHIDDRCEDAPAAARIASSFGTLLAILRAAQAGKGSSGKSDAATLLSALSIRPEASSVLVDWRATPGMLVELLGNLK